MSVDRPRDHAVILVLVVVAVATGGVIAGFTPSASVLSADGSVNADPPEESVATATPQGVGFTFVVVTVDECGLTCRNVTGALTNVGDRPARNASVTVTLHAGDESVWTDSRFVGRVGPGESVEATANVTVTAREAQIIQEHDGIVTVEIIVAHAAGRDRIETKWSVT